MDEPSAHRVVEDVATLKALADPLRMKVLELVMADADRTWTAKELAGRVGVPPTKIYYHLNMLELHKLLVVRDTRVVNGIIEKQYAAAQRDLIFRHTGAPGADAGLGDIVGTMLNQARDDMRAGLAAGTMSPNKDAPDSHRLTISSATADIPVERIAEFREALVALAQRFRDASSPEGKPFTMMIAMYPGGHAENGP